MVRSSHEAEGTLNLHPGSPTVLLEIREQEWTRWFTSIIPELRRQRVARLQVQPALLREFPVSLDYIETSEEKGYRDGGRKREDGGRGGRRGGKGKWGRLGASFVELFSNTVFYFHICVMNTNQQNFQLSKHRNNGKFVILL